MNLIFAAEGPNGFWIPGDTREFWWGSAAFLVVVALMVWKLLPLVRKAMSDRSDRIRDDLVAAERARVDAEAELASLRTRLSDADTESARIVEEARGHAETIKADLLARADAEAVDAREKAQVEIAASRGQATADLQTAIASQAADAAESVVSASLDRTTHDDLIDRYIEQVRTS